jgi:hypothetical protein
MTSDTASQDLEALRARMAQLEAGGLTHHESFEIATLEQRIARWPDDFGNDLVAIIFGDFDPPAADVVLPELGITILKDKVENSLVRSAMTVLKARVTVPSRTVEGLNDVVKRLNVLLGVYTLVEWGNSGSGWWSFVTHGTEGAVGTKIDHPCPQRRSSAPRLGPAKSRRGALLDPRTAVLVARNAPQGCASRVFCILERIRMLGRRSGNACAITRPISLRKTGSDRLTFARTAWQAHYVRHSGTVQQCCQSRVCW